MKVRTVETVERIQAIPIESFTKAENPFQNGLHHPQDPLDSAFLGTKGTHISIPQPTVIELPRLTIAVRNNRSEQKTAENAQRRCGKRVKRPSQNPPVHAGWSANPVFSLIFEEILALRHSPITTCAGLPNVWKYG